MIKTKYVKLLCVSVFLVSALTGCGKKPPTAEELLSQSFAETEYSYVNAKIDSAYETSKAIDAHKYLEYGELWFDSHSISTSAKNMERKISKIIEALPRSEETTTTSPNRMTK